MKQRYDDLRLYRRLRSSMPTGSATEDWSSVPGAVRAEHTTRASGRASRLLPLLLALGCATTAPTDTGPGVDECGVWVPIPDTRVYRSLTFAKGGACGWDVDGYVHCWGEPENCAMTGEPFRAFDLYYNVACGITEAGENRCWSWDAEYYPVDAATLVAHGAFDEVAVGGISACWRRDGESVVCLPEPICSGQDIFDPADCTEAPATVFEEVASAVQFSYCGITSEGSLECWGQSEPFAGLELPPLAFINNHYALDTEGRLWSADPHLPFLEGDVPFTVVDGGYHVLLLDEAGSLTDLVPDPDYENPPLCSSGVPPGPYSGFGSSGAMCVFFATGGGWCCADNTVENHHRGELLTFFTADTG